MDELKKKHAKPVSRRVKMLVRRHLRLVGKGKSCFDQANTALQLARTAGLEVGQKIDIEQFRETGEKETVAFELIDNTLDMESKGVIYRPARVPKFELKKVPKFSRKTESGNQESRKEEEVAS